MGLESAIVLLSPDRGCQGGRRGWPEKHKEKAREARPPSASGDEPGVVWASQVQDASGKVLEIRERG